MKRKRSVVRLGPILADRRAMKIAEARALVADHLAAVLTEVSLIVAELSDSQIRRINRSIGAILESLR